MNWDTYWKLLLQASIAIAALGILSTAIIWGVIDFLKEEASNRKDQ